MTKSFVASNPKQLDLCLKLLYAENVKFVVDMGETSKHKIEYYISVNESEAICADLERKYQILKG